MFVEEASMAWMEEQGIPVGLGFFLMVRTMCGWFAAA
jgi:hypothetical protein